MSYSQGCCQQRRDSCLECGVAAGEFPFCSDVSMADGVFLVPKVKFSLHLRKSYLEANFGVGIDHPRPVDLEVGEQFLELKPRLSPSTTFKSKKYVVLTSAI